MNPSSTEPPSSGTPVQPSTPTAALANGAPAGTSVLIVDDDDFSQDLFAAMFGSLGVQEVHHATDGRDALRQLAQFPQPPDYLVCDIFMPNMDGFEFLDQLAARRYAGHILLVTGVDSSLLEPATLVARSNGLQVLGQFNKPMSRDELIMALGRSGQRKA